MNHERPAGIATKLRNRSERAWNEYTKTNLVVLRKGFLDAPPQLVVFSSGHTAVDQVGDMPLGRSGTGGHGKVYISINELQDPSGQQLDLSLAFSCVRLLIRV